MDALLSNLPPIVTPEWLADQLARPEPGLVVADVRWYLDGRSGPDAYRAGHIPGAVFIDMDTVLAAHGAPTDGRHPLPSPETFAAGLAAAGIGDQTPVVAYDDLGGTVAGRLVWMLRILGSSAALLDGGLGAWSGPVVEGPIAPAATPAKRTAQPWPADAIATEEQVVAHIAAGGVVADSRAPERYRGDTEPIDPRAGHVPGAVNLPMGANLGPGGRFRPPAELASRFAEAGADEDAIFYCGSGVSACHNVLAMEASGRARPRVYVGSWSAWSSDPSRPAATGDTP